MARPPLILEPAEITTEWVQTSLSHAGFVSRVNEVSTRPVGTGLMGRSYRVAINAHGDAPASVVVKLASADPFTKELGASSYAREVGFYRDLAQRVTAKIPTCYYSDISANCQDFVLVLEDITPAAQGDQLRGCSILEAGRALENLARLHASTWGDTSIADHSWISSPAGGVLGPVMEIALAAFERRFGGLVQSSVIRTFTAFADRAQQWLDAEPGQCAAVHGDYRLDNLLFSLTDGSTTVVDWQTVNLLNPGRDLAYFLGNSLTSEVRRDAEDDLIIAYVDELFANGVRGYDRDTAVADMRFGVFQGPLVTMLGAFTAAKTARSDQMFTAMADRSTTQILDHDGLDLLF